MESDSVGTDVAWPQRAAQTRELNLLLTLMILSFIYLISQGEKIPDFSFFPLIRTCFACFNLWTSKLTVSLFHSNRSDQQMNPLLLFFHTVAIVTDFQSRCHTRAVNRLSQLGAWLCNAVISPASSLPAFSALCVSIVFPFGFVKEFFAYATFLPASLKQLLFHVLGRLWILIVLNPTLFLVGWLAPCVAALCVKMCENCWMGLRFTALWHLMKVAKHHLKWPWCDLLPIFRWRKSPRV